MNGELGRLCGTIGRAKQGQRGVCRRARSAVLAAALAITAIGGAPRPALAQEAAGAQSRAGVSGLPLPRFVSLKVDRVNLRAGPGVDYPAVWEYRRAGLPVEITDEYEGWRKVRDANGTAGWVLNSLVSGRRTALILPWEAKPGAPAPRAVLRGSDSARAREVALIEAGVIANVHSCDGQWCAVTIKPHRGYIEQAKLWGVYPNEVVK